MKIAIVHDDLMRRGGAEKVAKTISEMYPEAPIYTLCYRAEKTYPYFQQKKIKTSWFQVLARNETLMKWLFFPFGLMAMRSMKLKGYDLVIMSTTYCAKYVRVSADTKVIAYCYTPFRLAWNPNSYNVYSNSYGILRVVFDFVINVLRKVDKKASEQIDYFVAMTQETKERLVEAYSPSNEPTIINPAVELGSYTVCTENDGYYLIVSRFEPYKLVDLAIRAFNESRRSLIIVGKGSQEKHLRTLANSNISFRQNLSSEDLAKLYERCVAFIFPQHEDYGLTPIEANAAGKPVIAYNKGGVLDTMIPYQDDPINATAFFFNEQSVSSLNKAINEFEKLNFVPKRIRLNAERFSEDRFKQELGKFISSKLE